MDCAAFDADVDDFSVILITHTPKARKPHKCGECNRTIEPGEKYLLEKELYDGNVSTCKTCWDCKSVRDHLVGSFYWGQMWELVEECIDDCGSNQPWSKIGNLTAAAKRRVCAIIDRLWEDEEEEDE